MKQELIWAIVGMCVAFAIGLIVIIAFKSGPAATPEQKKVRELIVKLMDPDARTRKDAARALGRMGPAAEEAVPSLRKAIGDEPLVAIWAQYAIAEITDTDEPYVSAIAAYLRNEDDDLRGHAAAALGEMGPRAVKALPELMRTITEDKNPNVRFNAGLAVPKMKAKAVPALIEALKDPRDQIRRYAAQALGNIGPDAYPALAALKEVEAKDTDPVTRDAAKWAVSKIGGK